MENPRDRFRRLGEWIERVQSDVVKMHRDREVWQDLNEIVRGNPEIQTPGFLMHWITRGYVVSQVVGIRRHTDFDSRATSLARVLQAIIDQPEVVSRDLYRELHDIPPDVPDAFVDQSFSGLVGPGRDQIDPRAVRGDLERFIESTRPIKQYVNRGIAHLDKTPFDGTVTFRDLHSSLDLLIELVKRYGVILLSRTYDFDITWTFDWRDVLRKPWIPPQEERPSS